MSFLDPDLTRAFVDAFTATGARFLDRRQAVSAQYDGAGSCKVTLRDGEVLSAEKVLCAQGRQPSIDGLGLAEIGVETTSRGFVRVDAHCRTNVPTIYAVGDLVGPPALASTAMEQGRRAARHALGQSGDASRDGAARAALDAIPFCAYTIPEIASVGLGAAEARAAHGDVIIGRAPYAELARAHVSACGDGLIKLVACPAGQKLLGVQIVGEGASELVHVGQMGILGGVEIDSFIEATFNYPTLAEGYRVAALDIVRQRRR